MYIRGKVDSRCKAYPRNKEKLVLKGKFVGKLRQEYGYLLNKEELSKEDARRIDAIEATLRQLIS